MFGEKSWFSFVSFPSSFFLLDGKNHWEYTNKSCKLTDDEQNDQQLRRI